MSEGNQKKNIRKIKLKARVSESDSSIKKAENQENKKSGLVQEEIVIDMPDHKRVNSDENIMQSTEIFIDDGQKGYVFTSSEKYSRDKVVYSSNKGKVKFPLSLFPNKYDSVGEWIRKIVFLVAVVVMIVSLTMISQYLIENYQNEKRNNHLEQVYRSALTVSDSSTRLADDDSDEEEYYTMIPGASKLREINKDVAGYISIPDTGIDYPLMQGEKDNDEYLRNDIYGNSLRAGSIFLDYRNVFDEIENGRPVKENSDVLIVYGHNMRDESMFGKLKYYRNDENYYSEHPIIELNSNYKQYRYKIFGIFVADPDDEDDFDYWNKLDFKNKSEFYDYINEIKRRTIRNTNVDMEYGDKLLILSTCNSTVKNGRLCIAARLVRDDEELLAGTENSSVNENAKMPSSFYGSNGSTFNEDEFVPYEEK